MKEKPSPARMERARLSITDPILYCTSSIGRSVTSRQVVERPTSARVGVLELEAAEEALRFFRVWRMTESGFSLDLKGRASESESES